MWSGFWQCFIYIFLIHVFNHQPEMHVRTTWPFLIFDCLYSKKCPSLKFHLHVSHTYVTLESLQALFSTIVKVLYFILEMVSAGSCMFCFSDYSACRTLECRLLVFFRPLTGILSFSIFQCLASVVYEQIRKNKTYTVMARANMVLCECGQMAIPSSIRNQDASHLWGEIEESTEAPFPLQGS